MIKKKQMMSNIENLIKEKGNPIDVYIKTNDERKRKHGTNKYNNDVILVFDNEEVIVKYFLLFCCSIYSIYYWFNFQNL